jgi:ABC-2 type transport system permease protein
MFWRTAAALLRKEVLHILRDGQTWVLVVFTPALLLITFAYLFAFDVDHFSLLLFDQDNSVASRDYVRALTTDGVVRVEGQIERRDAVDQAMIRSTADAALIIPPEFGRELLAGRQATVQVAVDGSAPNTASRALAEISARSAAYSQQIVLRAQPARAGSLFEVQDKIWYNPALKSLVSMVPGLVAVVMAMPAFSAAQALAKEKELGTMESLLATPIGRGALIVGKGLPYMFSGVLGIMLTAAVAVLWFRVPFRGSFPLFLLLGLDFLFASNFMALLVANFVESQQAAMIIMFIMFILFFLPSFFLSGLLEPMRSAGLAARIEGALLPASYFVTISRGVFLKGIGLEYLWQPALGLFAIGLAAMWLAMLTVKTRLA